MYSQNYISPVPIPFAMAAIGNVVGGIVGYHYSDKHKFWGIVVGILAGGALLGAIGWVASDIYHGIKNPAVKTQDNG